MSFFNWLSASNAVDEHLENAASANLANSNHFADRADGVERVVDHHLANISQREINLSDFARCVADGLSNEDEA